MKSLTDSAYDLRSTQTHEQQLINKYVSKKTYSLHGVQTCHHVAQPRSNNSSFNSRRWLHVPHSTPEHRLQHGRPQIFFQGWANKGSKDESPPTGWSAPGGGVGKDRRSGRQVVKIKHK